MGDHEEELDWAGLVTDASDEGRLGQVLAKLPRACWTTRGPYGRTLLHLCGRGDNVSATAALLAHGLDLGCRDASSWTAAFYAAYLGQPRVLEVLLCAGADLGDTTGQGYRALELAIMSNQGPRAAQCARVLIANGARLATVGPDSLAFITSDLEAFERCVLRCRAVVVALLCVKRAGRLVRWDKFLLAHMAFELWSTRYDKGWGG